MKVYELPIIQDESLHAQFNKNRPIDYRSVFLAVELFCRVKTRPIYYLYTDVNSEAKSFDN